MKKLSRKFRKGQSLVEYGLILALVSIVAIAVLNQMGTKIKSTVKNVNDALDQAVTISGQSTSE